MGQKEKGVHRFCLGHECLLAVVGRTNQRAGYPLQSGLRRLIASAVDENRVVVVSTHQVRDLDNLIDPLIILDQSRILLHASIARIGERLSFSAVNDLAEAGEGLLYSEPSLRGFSIVGTPNGRPSDKSTWNCCSMPPCTNPKSLKCFFECFSQ